MNLSSILFLQASDLSHFAKVQDRYQGVRRLFIDPGLIEVAVREGVQLEPFGFVPPEFDPHLQARVASEASNRAASLDIALTRLRRELFGQGVFQGWDQSLLRQFFLRATLFRELGVLCEAQFPPGSVGLLRPLNPQLFYFDSFVATDLFSSGSPRWQVVETYDAAALWRPDAWSTVFNAAALAESVRHGVDCITHLPATYRHIGECQTEIARAFARSIDLPSEFWDIPVSRGETQITRLLSQSEVGGAAPLCAAYRERARSVFEQHLQEFLPHQYGARLQAELFAKRSYMQAVNFYALRDGLQGSRPHFVLTDHDTGNNGPLFSVAQQLGCGITVIPHSSYATGVIPHADQVEVIERDGFRTPVRTCLGEHVPTRGVPLGRPVSRRARSRVRTVCLLLNGIVSNGLFHLDFVGVTRFFSELAVRCREADVRLTVRLKPTASGLALISGALGVAAESLEQMLKPSIEEVAEASDLCVSFGQPTSGMINFLDSGCYLMHVGRQHWPADAAWAPAFVGDGTVAALFPAEALEVIGRLLGDAREYERVLGRQSEQYRARLTGQRLQFGPQSPRTLSSVASSMPAAEPVRPLAEHGAAPGSTEHKAIRRGAISPSRPDPDPVLWAQAIDAIPKPVRNARLASRVTTLQ